MSETHTYTLGQKVQVPIRLRDEDGIGHVSAVFRVLASPSIGPSALEPRTPQGSSWRATEKGKPKPP